MSSESKRRGRAPNMLRAHAILDERSRKPIQQLILCLRMISAHFQPKQDVLGHIEVYSAGEPLRQCTEPHFHCITYEFNEWIQHGRPYSGPISSASPLSPPFHAYGQKALRLAVDAGQRKD
jgi:hypothetical protein